MLSRYASLAILLGLVPLCTGAPATQPVKPKPDERQIVDKTYGFTFNVPKLWQQLPQKGERSIYVFQLPAPGGMAKATSSWIVLAEPEKSAANLEQLADRMRDNILTRTKDPKIESDKAVTLVGVEAWEFVYTMKMQVKTVREKGKDKLEETEDVPTRVRCNVFLHGEASYQFILTSDEAGYPNRVKAADRMLKTFVLGATTKP